MPILRVDGELSQLSSKLLRNHVQSNNSILQSCLCHRIGSHSLFQGTGHTTGSGSLLRPRHNSQNSVVLLVSRSDEMPATCKRGVKTAPLKPALAAVFKDW